MQIIPAIDILEGSVVRLYQWDYSKVSRYASDPYEVALSFKESGSTHLHIIDLSGAKKGAPQILKEIERLQPLGRRLGDQPLGTGGDRTFQ